MQLSPSKFFLLALAAATAPGLAAPLDGAETAELVTRQAGCKIVAWTDPADCSRVCAGGLCKYGGRRDPMYHCCKS